MQVHQIQSNNNSTAFKAGLSLSLIKENKDRWQKIAKVFEQKTKEYPSSKYQFTPIGSFSKGLNCSLTINGSIMPCAYIKLKPKMSKLMKDMSDNEIADKLKKLFSLWVELDNMYEQSWKLSDKMFCTINERIEPLKDMYDYIVDIGLENRAKSELNKDTFFKKTIKSLEFPYIHNG